MKLDYLWTALSSSSLCPKKTGTRRESCCSACGFNFKLVWCLQVLVGGILAVLITSLLVQLLISMVVTLTGVCVLCDSPQVR